VLRLQLGRGAGEPRSQGRIRVVPLSQPDTIAAALRGRFRADWRKVAARARVLRISRPLWGESLDLPVYPILEHLYLELFDAQAEHLELAGRVLDATRPDLVLVGNDRWWVGLSFVLAARARGIPTLCVVDGLTYDGAVWWWIAADTVAVAGEQWPRILVREGVDPSRIVQTGQPRFDGLCAHRSRAAVTAARSELGLQRDATYALFAAQPGQTPEFLRRVVDAILAADGVKVLLRPHPSQPLDAFSGFGETGSEQVVLVPRPPVQRLLAASDIVVTEYSTVGAEAAILGIPVVSALLGVRIRSLGPYEELWDVVRDADELTRRVRELISEHVRPGSYERRRAVAERFVGPLDGRASERVAELIRHLASSRRGA
jgi:UDP-N-acetylglucosamine 2-epimerase